MADALQDLAARIVSGGNILEQLERWAHEVAPNASDKAAARAAAKKPGA